MNKQQKAAVVEEVAAQIRDSEAIFAVDYRGISVPQAAELRAKLTDAGARFRVVKNTLTIRAAEQAGADELKELLEGPTAFTFIAGDGDVAVAAKALAQFRRQHDVLDFKGGRMSGEPLSLDQIETIARLPALEVLHGQLVGTVAAPITGLVRGLNALVAGLAIQLKQIADQGLVGGGEAPAGEAGEEPPGSEESSEEAGPAPEEPSTGTDQDAQAEEAADEAQESSGDEEGAEPSTEADQETSDASPSEGDAEKEG
jgi:large subunit ribosomal protein L10